MHPKSNSAALNAANSSSVSPHAASCSALTDPLGTIVLPGAGGGGAATPSSSAASSSLVRTYAAEMQPRCSRDAAEMQPRCSRDARLYLELAERVDEVVQPAILVVDVLTRTRA